MAHYVLSDIHGEADRFHRMLETIRFGDEDTLYIIGDVVDRGPSGIALLMEIKDRPNMVMLLGNHEHMMMRYFSPDVTELEIRRWNRNRNQPTKDGFHQLLPQQQRTLLDWINTLPTHMELTLGDRRFYLVHGFPGETLHDEVWGRPEPDTPNPMEDCRLILGHTPVLSMGRTEEEEEAALRALEEHGAHLRILHTPGFIDVDCCCGYPIEAKRLACLRLEDMAEFYC